MVATEETLSQVITRLYHAGADAEGQVSLAKVEEEATEYVRDHLELLEPRKIVHARLKQIDRQLRANLRDIYQPSFFSDAQPTYFPLGEGARLRNDSVGREHMDQYWFIRQQEHAAHTEAYNQDFRVYVRLIRAWKPEHRTLPDVWESIRDDDAK